MKSYCFEVNVKWVQIIDGKSKSDAIEKLQETFDQEFNFMPEVDEIKEIALPKGKKGGDNPLT